MTATRCCDYCDEKLAELRKTFPSLTWRQTAACTTPDGDVYETDLAHGYRLRIDAEERVRVAVDDFVGSGSLFGPDGAEVMRLYRHDPVPSLLATYALRLQPEPASEEVRVTKGLGSVDGVDLDV